MLLCSLAACACVTNRERPGDRDSPAQIRFAPIWAEAGRLLDDSEIAERVVLAKLDCNEHAKYCQERHSIDHFPTVRAYANGGAEMVNYEGNLGEASAIVKYVKQVVSTRQEAAAEVASNSAPLSFAVNESVQVWFHNGWRDAKVTGKVSEAELAALEEGQQAREYKVRFTSFEPPEDTPRHGRGMIVMFGGFIQMVEGGDGEDTEPDHNEHEVSVHIMRTKPAHKAPYRVNERVQLRVPSGWVMALVADTRPVVDMATNCTKREAAGECRTNPKHMLTQCMKTCHASSHPLEYKVCARRSASSDRIPQIPASPERIPTASRPSPARFVLKSRPSPAQPVSMGWHASCPNPGAPRPSAHTHRPESCLSAGAHGALRSLGDTRAATA